MKPHLLLLLPLLSTTASAVLVFGPASPVADLNSFETDQLTDLSADGLTATLQSNRDSFRVQIYSSTRATLSSPWSTPSNTDFAATNSFTNVGHAIISADGLELTYQQHPNIFTASRASTAVPFSAGTLNTELSLGLGYERPGKLSADGLRIYMEVYNGSNIDLYSASRPSLSSPWATPTEGPFAANVNLPGALELEPWISPNELELYFASDRPGGLGSLDIWWSSRASISDPFSTPVNVTSINTSGVERSPELFGDTLFFATTLSGNYDVFSAVALIPEPGAASLGVIALLGALRRRRK